MFRPLLNFEAEIISSCSNCKSENCFLFALKVISELLCFCMLDIIFVFVKCSQLAFCFLFFHSKDDPKGNFRVE